MRTTIFAYVIAIVGLALIVAGAWDIYLLSNEESKRRSGTLWVLA
jgi:hypothetical protein